MRNKKPSFPQKRESSVFNYDVISAPSAIEGSGVFASTAIPRRSKIGEVTGEIISRRTARKRARDSRRIYLVDVSDTHALDCAKGNILRHLNHCCAPNSFMRIFRNRVEVYARRDIEIGEEITVDYGETPHDGGMRCACGQSGCRNSI